MAWDRYLEIIINLSERGANTALASQSGLTALRQADFVQNDAFPLRLIFVQETGNPSAPVEVVRLEPGSTIVFSGKLASVLGGSTLLYYSDAFEEQGNDEAGWYYIADLDTNTEEVAAAFTALSSTKTTIATVNEVEIQNADNTQRTSFQHACLLRRQVYNGEGAPDPAGPEYPAPSSLATAASLAAEATARAAAHAAHIAGKAISFDGTGYATFSGGGIPAVGTGDFAVALWLEISALPSADAVILWPGGANGFGLKLTTSGAVQAVFSGVANLTASTATVSTGAWHHVAYVRNGTTGTYYIDRIAAGTTVDASNYSVATLNVGSTGSGYYFAGLLARPFPFNRALSADEVLALYNRAGLPLPSELGVSMTSLLSNGGFETGSGAAFTGWSTDTYGGGSVAQSTSDVHTGGRALRLTAASGANGAWAYYGTSGAGPLTAGKRYRLTFWAKSLAGNAVQIGDNINSTTYATIVLTGAWAKYTLEFVAQRSVLNFNVGFPSANLDVLIDDAELIPLGVLAAPMDADQCAGYQIGPRPGTAYGLNLQATGVEIVNPASRGSCEVALNGSVSAMLLARLPIGARLSRIEIFSDGEWESGMQLAWNSSGTAQFYNWPYANDYFGLFVLTPQDPSSDFCFQSVPRNTTGEIWGWIPDFSGTGKIIFHFDV